MKLFHILVRDHITCKSELQFDGTDYFSCEYNKIKGKMTQIGVRVQAAEVVVRQYGQNMLSLVYDEQADMWYQKSERWIEDGYTRATDAIFGINVGGSFDVVALDEARNVKEQVAVHITPGTMSIEEYKAMQQEVRHLFEVFSYDLAEDALQENNLLRRVQMPLFPLAPFQDILSQVELIVTELCERPEVELRAAFKKVNVKDVRKWTPSIIIEDALKQQGKVTALVNEQVLDIRENRMLKFMLEQYYERATTELAVEQRQRQLFESEIHELNVMLAQTYGTLAAKPQQLLAVLESDCVLLESRAEQWCVVIRVLEDLLEQQLLQVESVELEETHLFRMHPHYSELYDLFSQYQELTPELTDTFRLFIQSLLKSPTLYEVWVLLKIVQQLRQWGVNPKEFVVDIEQNYIKPNTHSISGYRKRFRLADRPFDIALYYDVTFEETGYRPDFVIGFLEKETRQWTFHTLDVKYKNYTAMKGGRASFEQDLERSAYRYLEELLRPNNRVQSASLVHLDALGGHWNTKPAQLLHQNEPHKLAHFMLSPTNSKNLHIYLKRLLHEGSGFEGCCPSCGHEKQGEQKNYRQINDVKRSWKTQYSCDDCNELWVANFCSDCSFNDRNYLTRYDEGFFHYPRPLYKYPTYNYNVQVRDEWEVHCPTCNCLSYPERPYTFTDDDYSGPNVEYHTRNRNFTPYE